MEERLLIQGWGVFEDHTEDRMIAKSTLWKNQAQCPKAVFLCWYYAENLSL
jgi:hypothetical protein